MMMVWSFDIFWREEAALKTKFWRNFRFEFRSSFELFVLGKRLENSKELEGAIQKCYDDVAML